MSRLTRDQELAQRKVRLQARITEQRRALSQQVQGSLARPLAWADKVSTAGRWLRAHPAIPAGVLAALVAWRPKGLLGWAGKGLWLWRTWRKVQPLVQTVMKNNTKH